jgi:pimeloyl-ACP methyl ester carboxylesterase
MAAELHSRLIVVDTPGYGVPNSGLNPREARELAFGRFDAVASTMMSAAVSAAEQSDPLSGSVGVIGYSMGASLAAALAALLGDGRGPDRTTLGPVILIEPVAVRRNSLLCLVRRSGREERRIEEYLGFNRDIPWAVLPLDRRKAATPPPAPRRHAADLLLLGVALARGGLPASALRAARSTPGLPVLLAYGNASEMCSADEISVFARQLRTVGATVDIIPVPGAHHAMWQSLPHVLHLARDIARLVER